MKPLFLAGQAGLDFLNTRFIPPGEQTPIELIGDGQSFVAWLLAAELLDTVSASKLKRRFGANALDEVAREARQFRHWVGEWIARWSETPDGEYDAERRRLNRLLERGHCYRELVTVGPSSKLVEHCHMNAATELLALVAFQVALLISGEAPRLVKRCAGADCVLWFVDRTKAHRRMFCSAAACGNRAKVAAFRERERGKT